MKRTRSLAVCPPLAAFLLLAAATGAAIAAEIYKRPPQNVVDILEAPPPPRVIVSPTHERILLVAYEPNPPIALLARSFLRLGGVRVDPARGSTHRALQYTGIVVVDLADGAKRPIALPEGARIQMPSWSHDGKRIAFARDTDTAVELWVADVATGAARVMSGVQLDDVLGSPFEWMADSRRLLVRAVPRDRSPAPARPAVPAGPNVQESQGKHTRMATYQDLLQDEHDADLFEHFARSQLAVVDVESGAATDVGAPAPYAGAEFSPDGNYLLVTRLERPFSFRVPYYYFGMSIEIWKADGTPAAVLARRPVADEVPMQGVPTGPRQIAWQPLRDATLVWAEALDGGDPRREVPHRDRLVQLDLEPVIGAAGSEPLAERGREALRLEERFQSVRWTARRDRALVGEYDRDRRWRTTWLVDFASSPVVPKKIFDLSANDDYNDPGNPVSTTLPDGQRVLLQDGERIYLAGRGATEAGDRPFLDRLDLGTLRTERLFHSEADCVESFVAFGPGKDRRWIVTSRESRREPPNTYLLDSRSGKRTQLTDYRDPAPELTGIESRLLRYRRADGVPLSGILYLPPGHTAGTRLPLVVWAYPREFSDAGTAGQVRGSPNAFVRLAGDSPLFFLTQGYAVLQNATMPVVGDPETMNDTYVEQIVASARAAIDTLDAMGVIDRDRACIAGHSYGAFMTANLLAHSNLFAAGIARSGAYNRSLTPFGFQAERRSYWEATDVYTRISPFTYAHKIDEPILMIHGEEDNNSGTFPIQSERLFQAIQGNGGTARLVMLPHESHGYRSRESVLHVLAEMFEWCDRYVKNRQPAAAPETQSRR